MNKIEKLIEELCPWGVEFKALGEVCRIKTGQSVNKILIDQNPGDYPVINSGKEPLGYIDTFNTENDPIGITSRGAGVGSITWCVGEYFRGNLNYSATIIDEMILNVRYLYFALMNSQKQINELSVFNGIPALNASSLVKLKIPIPPLAIQEEIVKILDNFTQLEAELEAELESRKKQYEYYREALLTFGDDVEWKALGEVSKIQRGASPRPIAKFVTDDENGVPWIKIGDTTPSSKYVEKTAQKITPAGAKQSRFLNKGDFIISNSMSFGRPYILNIDGAIHDGWASISDFGDKLNSDYLYHYLSSNYVQNYWISKINSGSVSNLNADIIKSLSIPIPPLSKQKEIVAILDKFDALVNGISTGLPAEIAARKKQYEYYRNQLLTFKPLELQDAN